MYQEVSMGDPFVCGLCNHLLSRRHGRITFLLGIGLPRADDVLQSDTTVRLQSDTTESQLAQRHWQTYGMTADGAELADYK